MNPELIIGLDPQGKGAMSWIDHEGNVSVAPIPESLMEWRDMLRDVTANYMPKRTRCYLSTEGVLDDHLKLEMALVCFKLPYQRVLSKTWQDFLSIEDKDMTSTAKKLFPSIEVSDDTSRALVLLEFARKKWW